VVAASRLFAPKTASGKKSLPALIRLRIIPNIDSSGERGYIHPVKNPGLTVKPALMQRLALKGFRLTPQREHVYRVLLQDRDHPTAEQVFMRAKKTLPDISMATVYNCLDFRVKCSLVKEVNLDRTAMRYCPNMHEHCHFHCDECGGVFDIDFCADDCRAELKLPRGFQATGYDVSIHGACPRCSAPARP